MQQNNHIHFIGIGGIGMSALARHYLHEGWQVSGSDASESELTKTLAAEGVSVTYVQEAGNITPALSLVVYTEAMAPDHPELIAARSAGIETINYFEALGRVANQYYLIAIAGTHGKTTTTAMLADILEEASLDPSVVVGSLRSKTGSNYRAGKSKYFIAEACEYRRDFLHLQPDVLIITNIEHEHVDYYADLAAVQAAFRELAAKVPENGAIVCNATDPNLAPVIQGLTASVIDYKPAIDLSLALKQPGLHNRQNAAAARTAAHFLGVEEATSVTALEQFAGTWRRFQYKGDIHNAPVYDDYAHHPTELRAAILGARELYPRRALTIIFQPHTYSRTKVLRADFAAALALADHVILLPIYAAREPEDAEISSELLAADISALGTSATHYFTLEAAAQAVKQTATSSDVILCVGAGTVTKVANLLTDS
jgi:UDP-N-acetylmuramate--alanine ligase